VVGRSAQLVLANPKVAATSLQEFVALAKANPNTLNYSTPGAFESGPSAVRAVEPAGRHQDAAQSAGATRDYAPAGVDYGAAGICRGRLPHGLWRTDSRQLSTSRRLRCKNSARRRPGRASGRPADRIRLRHQSEDRGGPWPRAATSAAGPRRKDRVCGETILNSGDCAARRNRRHPYESYCRVRWQRPAYRLRP